MPKQENRGRERNATKSRQDSDSARAYWGEIERDELLDLIQRIEAANEFELTVMKFFQDHPRKDLYTYITDVQGRSCWHEFVKSEHVDVAVDLGAGLGAITEFLSRRYAKVYAIEGVEERVRLLSARARFQGLNNVSIIRADVTDIPVADKSADLVVCNGVLEWVAQNKTGRVAKLQDRFLKEIARVLKDDGVLYIGIENRFALNYFLGDPDHNGRRYTSLVPRWAANLLMHSRPRKTSYAESVLNGPYRTYTYSALGYYLLLKRAGLKAAKFFCVEPSYDIPRYAYPLFTRRSALRTFAETFLPGRRYELLKQILCTNYFIFASKTEATRIAQREPTYFGYEGATVQENGLIRKRGPKGTVSSVFVRGQNVLAGACDLSTADIIRCYETYYHSRNSARGTDRWKREQRFFEQVAGVFMAPEGLLALNRSIEASHLSPRYHGDMWLGNIILESAGGRLALIDPEQHIYGSLSLDILDFAIDYCLNGRAQGFPGIDLVSLAAHFGVNLEDRDLQSAAILRQIYRYSPKNRSHALVYTYISLLYAWINGDIGLDWAGGLRSRIAAS